MNTSLGGALCGKRITQPALRTRAPRDVGRKAQEYGSSASGTLLSLGSQCRSRQSTMRAPGFACQGAQILAAEPLSRDRDHGPTIVPAKRAFRNATARVYR